jgi:hypothetical protein
VTFGAFAVLPKQGDLVSIPPHESIWGGEFIVTDRSSAGNAGGEITLQLKRVRLPKLVGAALVLGAPVFARPALGPQGLTRLPMHSQRQRNRHIQIQNPFCFCGERGKGNPPSQKSRNLTPIFATSHDFPPACLCGGEGGLARSFVGGRLGMGVG